MDSVKLNSIKDLANKKFKDSEYWRLRDKQFGIASFLDRVIVPLDSRAIELFKTQEVTVLKNPVIKLK